MPFPLKNNITVSILTFKHNYVKNKSNKIYIYTHLHTQLIIPVSCEKGNVLTEGDVDKLAFTTLNSFDELYPVNVLIPVIELLL